MRRSGHTETQACFRPRYFNRCLLELILLSFRQPSTATVKNSNTFPETVRGGPGVTSAGHVLRPPNDLDRHPASTLGKCPTEPVQPNTSLLATLAAHPFRNPGRAARPIDGRGVLTCEPKIRRSPQASTSTTLLTIPLPALFAAYARYSSFLPLTWLASVISDSTAVATCFHAPSGSSRISTT